MIDPYNKSSQSMGRKISEGGDKKVIKIIHQEKIHCDNKMLGLWVFRGIRINIAKSIQQ